MVMLLKWSRACISKVNPVSSLPGRIGLHQSIAFVGSKGKVMRQGDGMGPSVLGIEPGINRRWLLSLPKMEDAGVISGTLQCAEIVKIRLPFDNCIYSSMHA